MPVLDPLVLNQQFFTLLRSGAVEAANNLGTQHPRWRPRLVGKNLSKLNLVGVNAEGEPVGINLVDADLWGADLHRTNLTGALLAGANLGSARLTGADLSDADLTDANLSRAWLDEVRWTPRTRLIRANFAGATLDSDLLQAVASSLFSGWVQAAAHHRKPAHAAAILRAWGLTGDRVW